VLASIFIALRFYEIWPLNYALLLVLRLMYVGFCNVCLNSCWWFMLCLVYISCPVLVLTDRLTYWPLVVISLWTLSSGLVPGVEAGSNTSTVTLRVVGGDEKGSLESETVNYGLESYGTRTRKWLRWRGPVAIANDRPGFSSERAPQINKPATVRQ
jgi:hypothetical protein